MPDYSKGKVYTIRNKNDDNQIYVGSTIQSLAVRLGGHKKNSKREECMMKKLYIQINNDWDNWYIELYENYPCNSKEELHKREGEIIRLIGTLNSNIAGRDRKQHYIENTDKLKEKMKQYQIENADKLKEYTRQYYIENANKILRKQKEKNSCDCGSYINNGNFSRHLKTKKHQDYLASLS